MSDKGWNIHVPSVVYSDRPDEWKYRVACTCGWSQPWGEQADTVPEVLENAKRSHPEFVVYAKEAAEHARACRAISERGEHE